MQTHSVFRDPAFRAKFIFGQEMKACPKCKGYNIGFSTPIKLNGPLPDTAKGMLGAWAKARKGGATPLEGTCRIMCRSCGHLGPAVNVEGRTAEDVGRDKAVCDEVKRLWNSEQNTTATPEQSSSPCYPVGACAAKLSVTALTLPQVAAEILRAIRITHDSAVSANKEAHQPS